MQPHEHLVAPAPPPAFTLTDSASARINALKASERKPNLRFRITVKGGGCSGFQYDFALDDGAPAAEDMIFAHNGAEVIVDNVSLGIIGGSVLDYTEDLSSAGFSIKNPHATAKCGCGNSFAVTL
ncbi:MAG: iron-sulfur cluster assembly accessory protein [Pseudomonadota bacterium]|nr:iron-sulfur cluster assembly accessory protein [Pseudomonadota bacterium]MDE3038016.1 iron-sulfur cluster assembly accessory protein [Pseudomonadota bacterium]